FTLIFKVGEDLGKFGVAAADEVLVDVRRARGAERADRERGRAAGRLLGRERLGSDPGWKAALHQVPQPRVAVAGADPDRAAPPQEVEAPARAAPVVPAAGAGPRAGAEVVDLARRRLPLAGQLVQDVLAPRPVLVPPGEHALGTRAVPSRPRAHLVGV